MPIQTLIAKDFVKKSIPFIKQAQNSIDIVVFDWRWYANDPGSQAQIFNQEIVQAARRGVKIRALVNSDVIANHLKSVKILAKKFCSKHLLHAKFMIIDEKIVLTGSHNYTQSAFNANYELSVLISDPYVAKECLIFFNSLYNF